MADPIRIALLREVHRAISEAADAGVAHVASAARGTKRPGPVALTYPPGDGKTDDHVLTPAEASALARIASSDAARTGLRKLLREAASAPLFHLFSLLDGVVDPVQWDDDLWPGADIVPRTDDEDREMLHDAFLESYGDFVGRRARR